MLWRASREHLPMTIQSSMQLAAAAKTEAMMENPRTQQRSRRQAAAACLALFLTALCGTAARAQSVAFINPGKSDEIYWMTATQGMQAVARSLGMTFEVQYAQREPLKTFDASPVTKQPVKLLSGRFGDYVTDGVTNATLPRDFTPESLTFEQALNLLAERAARGPSTRGRRGRGAKAAKKK
jgi:hypothetical protein